MPYIKVGQENSWSMPYPNTGKRLPGLIKDMELVVIEGGPHAIAWTHADRVNQTLLGFLN